MRKISAIFLNTGIQANSSFRKQDMKVRMKIKNTAESMHNRGKAGDKTFFFAPRRDSFPDRLKKQIQAFSIGREKATTIQKEEKKRYDDKKHSEIPFAFSRSNCQSLSSRKSCRIETCRYEPRNEFVRTSCINTNSIPIYLYLRKP